MISIIIPVYNVERFLPKCLDSILAQTFTDFEVILVNDGSVDGSGKICDEYAQRDDRVQVIHKTNGGVSSARNRGLSVATGHYICFIDSDDWIDPTFLADFRTEEYSADLYISGALYDIDCKVYSYKKYEAKYINDRVEIGKEFTHQNIWQNGYPWGKLYRSEIIKLHNLCFDEELSIHEDHLFIFKYYTYITDIYVTGSAGYHYLVIDNSKRKLSNKVNHYEELLYASESFSSVLYDVSLHFLLEDNEHEILYNSYVIGCHSRAFAAIFNSKDKNSNLYNRYKNEVTYWREKQNSDKPASFGVFLTCVMKIMLNIRFETVGYLILSTMFFLKRTVKRNTMKLIYADLDTRSERM